MDSPAAASEPDSFAEGMAGRKCFGVIQAGSDDSKRVHLDPEVARDSHVSKSDVNVALSSSNPFGSGYAYEKENIPKIPQEKADRSSAKDGAHLVSIGLDLNMVIHSSVAENNPFYPYKNVGQSRAVDMSECGSTTGPVEESEPLRKWKEMKRNGFLSLPQKDEKIPRPRGRPRKRKEGDMMTKNTNPQYKELAEKSMKVAAPSGLLSGLNFGIINHVRNSKQVYSIIEALVQSENIENTNQPDRSKSSIQLGQGGKTANSRQREEHFRSNLTKSRFMSESASFYPFSTVGSKLPSSRPLHEHKFSQGFLQTSKITANDDDNLKLGPSSALTLASGKTTSASTDDVTCSQNFISPLSVKAATVASQWMELLHQDLRGRLAALKRSRKRLRNVVCTELPYMLSSMGTKDSSFSQCYDVENSESGVPDDKHVEGWRVLFSKMDKELQEERRKLENFLIQVQDMQLKCARGLRQAGSEGPTPGLIGDFSITEHEAQERARAVQAAAASLHSTCNMVTRKVNTFFR